MCSERLCGDGFFDAQSLSRRDRAIVPRLVLARSSISPIDALKAAHAAAARRDDPAEADRVGDPGYHLIAEGRPALEQSIGFRPHRRLWISRLSVRLGIGGYVGVILGVTVALLALALWALAGLGIGWLALFAVVAFLPATEIATRSSIARSRGASAR